MYVLPGDSKNEVNLSEASPSEETMVIFQKMLLSKIAPLGPT